MSATCNGTLHIAVTVGDLSMKSYLERKMFPKVGLLEFVGKVSDGFMELFVARPVAP